MSSRSATKLKVVPFIEEEHDEDNYDDQDCRRLEEEFEAEYDYPSQEEEQTYSRTEQQPAETTDSGNEVSSNSDSEGENNYCSTVHQEESSRRGKKRYTSIPQQEESLPGAKKIHTSMPRQEESSLRGRKQCKEEHEEEEGEVSDDGDGSQSQVNST